MAVHFAAAIDIGLQGYIIYWNIKLHTISLNVKPEDILFVSTEMSGQYRGVHKKSQSKLVSLMPLFHCRDPDFCERHRP